MTEPRFGKREREGEIDRHAHSNKPQKKLTMHKENTTFENVPLGLMQILLTKPRSNHGWVGGFRHPQNREEALNKKKSFD